MIGHHTLFHEPASSLCAVPVLNITKVSFSFAEQIVQHCAHLFNSNDSSYTVDSNGNIQETRLPVPQGAPSLQKFFCLLAPNTVVYILLKGHTKNTVDDVDDQLHQLISHCTAGNLPRLLRSSMTFLDP